MKQKRLKTETKTGRVWVSDKEMAPREFPLPEARTIGGKPMIDQSLAHPAPHPTTEKAFRPCAACGEPSGSISAGTGRPVVRERETGRYYHVRCHPGSPSGKKAAVVLAGVL